MHELSIVMSIISTAQVEVVKNAASYVERIDLEIGALAGVETEALDFAWAAAVPETVLANAERHIHHIPAMARCAGCGHQFEIRQLFEPCPQCDEYFSDLLQGKELKIRKMTLVRE